MQGRSYTGVWLAVTLLTMAGCAPRSPSPSLVERIPPLSAEAWREIKEDVWTASALAQAEAESSARQEMQEWMARVRAHTESSFVPWYTGYWAQQWIGFKAGWYEMNKEEGQASVEDYLVGYLQEKFYELVLQPAGVKADPQSISQQAAALYVRLLSMQLQCLPKIHGIPPKSLAKKLQQIPLITLPGSPPISAFLSQAFEHDDLTGVAAYDALMARVNSLESQENSSPKKERLQVVAEDTVAQLVAQLPLRAGGGTVAMVVGEALGLFVSAGITAWSAISHDQEQPQIESRLREALDAGLDDMWQTVMEDPELGVLFPVNHMRQQIETGLFPAEEHEPVVPF